MSKDKNKPPLLAIQNCGTELTLDKTTEADQMMNNDQVDTPEDKMIGKTGLDAETIDLTGGDESDFENLDPYFLAGRNTVKVIFAAAIEDLEKRLNSNDDHLTRISTAPGAFN